MFDRNSSALPDPIVSLKEEIERLYHDGTGTTGNWSVGQIFFHLAAAFEGSVEGLPPGYPRIIRMIIRPFHRARQRDSTRSIRNWHEKNMAKPINPYEAPRDYSFSETNRNLTSEFPAYSKGMMAASVLIGGIVTALSIYFIYVDDPRTGTLNGPPLDFAVAAGAASSSIIWLISGFLQRRGMVGLMQTFFFAAVSAGGWILMAGTTYADVLGAAACVGWPIGGFIASVVSFYLARRNVKWQSKSRID